MRYLIIAFMVGFLIRPVSAEIYGYYWWKNANYCYDYAGKVTKDDNEYIENTNKCFKRVLGPIYYLKHISIRPHIGQKLWEGSW